MSDEWKYDKKIDRKRSNIGDANIPDIVTNIIAELKQFSGTLYIDLSHNNIGNKGAARLIEKITKYSNTIKLNLSYNGINAEGLTNLENATKNASNHIYIAMTGNKIPSSKEFITNYSEVLPELLTAQQDKPELMTDQQNNQDIPIEFLTKNTFYSDQCFKLFEKEDKELCRDLNTRVLPKEKLSKCGDGDFCVSPSPWVITIPNLNHLEGQCNNAKQNDCLSSICLAEFKAHELIPCEDFESVHCKNVPQEQTLISDILLDVLYPKYSLILSIVGVVGTTLLISYCGFKHCCGSNSQIEGETELY